MGVVHQPVEGGIGQGGFTQGIVPTGDRKLAGDDGGAPLAAVLDDLEEIRRLVGGEWPQGQVVEDEDVDLGERHQEPRPAAVEAGQSQVGEQTWHPLVEGGAAGSDSGLGQGAGEE